MIAGKIEVIVWITKVKSFHLQNAPRDGEDGCRRGKEYNKITSETQSLLIHYYDQPPHNLKHKVKGSDANHHYLTSCLIMTASDLSDQVLVMLSDKPQYIVKLMSQSEIFYQIINGWFIILPPDQRLAEDKEDCRACLHRVLHTGIRLYSFGGTVKS